MQIRKRHKINIINGLEIVLESRCGWVHHMYSDIYVHRRKPMVSSPASNGFHECGHIQEERESLKKPPLPGAFSRYP
jgi:hypothetical protein